MSMQLGLFGGTFNPIHNGHLMVAQRVLKDFALDRLYIIPCLLPPHKHPTFLAPSTQRVGVIKLALPDDARYHLSDVEIKRRGPSYTIDTVDHFRTLFGHDANLFLPMGMDAFLDIHTWKSYRRLLTWIQPVIVTRCLEANGTAEDELSRLDRYICSRLSADFRYDPSQSNWQNGSGSMIHLLSVPPVDISSNQIRQRIGEGKHIADLVPSAVDAYIEKKELYR